MSESVSQVYVVDDDVSVREGIGDPDPVSWAKSRGLLRPAQEIVASLRKERPSCLVLDIQLPDINGFELQQELVAKDIQIPSRFSSPAMQRHSNVGASDQSWRAGVFDKAFRRRVSAGGNPKRDRSTEQSGTATRKYRSRQLSG